jgi:putative membrane protein
MDWSWSAGGWWWMTIAMVVFWGLVAWVAFTLARRPGAEDGGSRSAADILAERYAQGEIDDEEYQRRRAALRH